MPRCLAFLTCIAICGYGIHDDCLYADVYGYLFPFPQRLPACKSSH